MFELKALNDLQRPDKALVIDEWRQSMEDMLSMKATDYGAATDLRLGHEIQTLNSLIAMAIATAPAQRRQDADADAKLEAFFRALQDAGLAG